MTAENLEEIVCCVLGDHDDVANIDAFSETDDCSLEGKSGVVVWMVDGSEFEVSIRRIKGEAVSP